MLRITTCCALLLAATALPAVAAPNTNQYNAGAAMACRPALPAFDGAIRTRPLGMGNEGAGSAFVTCTNWSEPFSAPNYNTVVQLLNRGSATVTASCTLVAGGDTGPAPEYTTKSTTLGPGLRNNLVWGNLSFPNLPSTLRYSCALPPGVELQTIMWGYVV